MGRIRYAGFAEEYSFNPDTPPDAIFHIDIGSATLDVPADPNLHFEGGLYRGRKIVRPGFYAPAGNIVYPVDIRSIAYILKWALGNYVFTDGGEGANTHEIYGIEDLVLPSFCTRLGKDNFEHIFTGCVVNSLELKIEGEYVFIAADIIAARDYKGAVKAIADLLLFDEYPLSFIDATISLTTDYSCKIKGITLSLANNPDVAAGKGVGSRHPCRMPIGARDINVSGNLYFEDSSEYEKFWGASGGISGNLPTDEELVITIDSGAYGSMEIKIPKFMFTDLKTPPSGRTEIVQAFSGIGLMKEVTLADELTKVDTDLIATINNDNDDLDEDIIS